MSFCRWYNKQLIDVTENEQSRCHEDGIECIICCELVVDSEEEQIKAGVNNE